MLAWLLAASWAAAAAPPADDARRAAELERRLAALTARLDERREDFAVRVVGQAALVAQLERFGASGPEEAALKDELLRAVRARRDASVASAVEATLAARRLAAYKENGVLPPEAPDDGSIARALVQDAPSAPAARTLPSDLAALARELGVRLPSARSGGSLPSAPPAVARRAPRAPSTAAFVPDRGTGRAAVDPVPGLIAELAASEAPRRALAADQLAGRGRAASAAVPALRAALSDADARVRSSSVTALGAIVPPDSAAVQDIRRLLSDRDEDVRFSARTALSRLGRP
ncbi:MAG: HEAT repeat domain-containing protein [Elusimicrobia bacterium]|nr:HEAT repeat domain-containing protein [Elusimicrobiota bacterium]